MLQLNKSYFSCLYNSEIRNHVNIFINGVYFLYAGYCYYTCKKNILNTSTFSDIMIWKPYKLNLHIGHTGKKNNPLLRQLIWFKWAACKIFSFCVVRKHVSSYVLFHFSSFIFLHILKDIDTIIAKARCSQLSF